MKKFIDEVVNEARRKCIEEACVPRSIIENFNTKIENGKLIIKVKT